MSAPIRVNSNNISSSGNQHNSPATFSRLSGTPMMLSGSPRLSVSTPVGTPPSSTKLGCHSPYTAVVLRSTDSSKVASPISLPPSTAEWDAATKSALHRNSVTQLSVSPPAYTSAHSGMGSPSSSFRSGHHHHQHQGQQNVSLRKLSGRAQFLRLEDVPLIHAPFEDLSTDLSIAPMQHPYELPTLFVGQLKYEITPTQLAHVVEHFSGVKPLRVEYRPKGCAMLFLKSREDAASVMQLHKRLLFDYNGVWFAADESQRAALDEAARIRLERLPNDCVSVEEPRNRPQYAILNGHVVPCQQFSNASQHHSHHHHGHHSHNSSTTSFSPAIAHAQSPPSAPSWCSQLPPPPPSYVETTTTHTQQRSSGNDHSMGATATQSSASTPRQSLCGSPVVRPRMGSDPIAPSSSSMHLMGSSVNSNSGFQGSCHQ
jgi:RNA recognition motif-containing protein